jgi:hypothetical protein
MIIQGNEQPRYCTKYKTYEGALVPWAWHCLSLLYNQANASRLAHLRYPEGIFQAGEKFVHALPVKHPLEDKTIHLELSSLHEPLMVAPERLPVACIFNSGLLSSLVDHVDIITPELVLCDFIVCLDT